ncbi:MAG: sialidase family protein, partial [bacterium]|nr:sialidase family protein [bacterium]
HFADGKIPDGKLIELTIRERCFKPEFSEFKGRLFIQTMGMVVEHAADPGAFSLYRPLTIRKNSGTGIIVRKTLSVPSNIVCCSLLSSQISYTSKNKDNSTLISALGISKDGGRTWTPAKDSSYDYFMDEENGMLLRRFSKVVSDADRGDALGFSTYEHFQQISRNEGKTWSEPERIEATGSRMLKLQNGKLFGITGENQGEPGFYYAVARAWLGTWRHDLSGIDWKPGGTVKAEPRQSVEGFDEPHACQFPDGRIFIIGRQSSILPTHDSPGFTSVKLFAISEDNGRTWSKVKPLTYEDGTYVYSSTSFSDTFCSSKNGKVYVIININDEPSHGCDPRTTLQIAELDTSTCCVEKDMIAIIDTKHKEHYSKVRFSNWSMIEDRDTKNLLLFMKLDMSEDCPIRNGYDLNCYRYEIELPQC